MWARQHGRGLSAPTPVALSLGPAAQPPPLASASLSGASSLTPAWQPLACWFLRLCARPGPAPQITEGPGPFTASRQRANTQTLWPRPSQSDCGHCAHLFHEAHPPPDPLRPSSPSSRADLVSACPMVTAAPWPLAIRGLLWARHVLDIHPLADGCTSSPGLSHDLADPPTWLPAQPLHLKSNRQLRLPTSHTSPDVIPPTYSSCSLPSSEHGNPTGVDQMPSFVSYFISGPSAPVGSTIKTHPESHHFYHFHPLPP